MKKQQFQGACIFCGGKGLSKEHVFARWMHPYLPIEKIVNHNTLFELILPEGTSKEEKKRSGDPHSRSLKVVCETCNTGWMSRLQEDAKEIILPLMLGERIVLNRARKTLLASWATMFVMVAEWGRQNPDLVTTSHTERAAFKLNRMPPQRWKFWIGQMAPGAVKGVFSLTTLPVSGKNVDVNQSASGAPLPNTKSTTVAFSDLLLHVFSSRVGGLSTIVKLPPNKMMQVWPIRNEPIAWPLTEKVTGQEAVKLADGLQAKAKSVLAAKGFTPFAELK